MIVRVFHAGIGLKFVCFRSPVLIMRLKIYL